MCNLSQGIVDDTKVEIIINMYENKFSLIVKVVVSKNLYSCFDRLSDIVLYLT